MSPPEGDPHQARINFPHENITTNDPWLAVDLLPGRKYLANIQFRVPDDMNEGFIRIVPSVQQSEIVSDVILKLQPPNKSLEPAAEH